MSNVFDLSSISRLVDSQHPSRMLVKDTNVVMNNPDPSDWRVDADGKSLFLLSDTVVLELALIRQKRGSQERLESAHKADIATKSLAGLFGQGSVTDGIPIEAGWAVCVPTPKKDDLDPELEQLRDIMDVFRPSDTKLLLLTRECHQVFSSIPVTMVTADESLYNIVEAQGVPCHLCRYFPIQGLKEAAAAIAPVDWDKELTAAQARIVEKSTVVELTLSTRRAAPSWLISLSEAKQFVVAEGRGVVRLDSEAHPFLWTISFYPQTIGCQPSDADAALVDLPSVHLDFFGEDDLEQDLFDAVADRLLDCAGLTFEEGKPTLQSPQSTMEILLYLEYLLREGMSEEALDNLRQEIQESEGFTHYWTEWILSAGDEDVRYACLKGLVEALNNCWEIGQTYTFGIMRGQEDDVPE